MGPNATAAHQQQLNEDNRQALVLFSIVIIFLISNVPRIALNIHEVHVSMRRIIHWKPNIKYPFVLEVINFICGFT